MSGVNARAVRWLRALLVVALGTAGGTRASNAAANAPSDLGPPAPRKTPVHIERSSCRAVPITEVLGVLRVELGTQLVEWPLPADAYQVVIDCSDDVVVISVSVTDRETRSYRTNLTNAPSNVRPRIVALAIAEIVRDLDRESAQLAVATSAAKEMPAPQAAIEPKPALAAVVETRPARFAIFAETSTFRLDGRWLAGGGARFDYVYGWLCAGVDAGLLGAEDGVGAGTVRVLMGYGSPHVAWMATHGKLQSRLGVGYALGAANIAGNADAARGAASVTGPWGAPYAFGAVAFPMTRSIAIDLRAQAGWVTLSVVGLQRVTAGSDVHLDGLWTSVQIGTSFTL